MKKRRRQAGYSLLEISVSLAVFGAFLAIVFILTAEMRRWEKKLPVNFMRHPQVIAVVARMRRDVLDAYTTSGNNPYRAEHAGFSMSAKTLILDSLQTNGTVQTVVWDFNEAGVVRRYSYTNELRTSQWFARGLPADFSSTFDLEAVEFENRPFGVRITARDSNGRLAIDQILQPRAHE